MGVLLPGVPGCMPASVSDNDAPAAAYISVGRALCVTCVDATGHLHMESGASQGHQRITV